MDLHAAAGALVLGRRRGAEAGGLRRTEFPGLPLHLHLRLRPQAQTQGFIGKFTRLLITERKQSGKVEEK